MSASDRTINMRIPKRLLSCHWVSLGDLMRMNILRVMYCWEPQAIKKIPMRNHEKKLGLRLCLEFFIYILCKALDIPPSSSDQRVKSG